MPIATINHLAISARLWTSRCKLGPFHPPLSEVAPAYLSTFLLRVLLEPYQRGLSNHEMSEDVPVILDRDYDALGPEFGLSDGFEDGQSPIFVGKRFPLG
jgi:hypothetical protein